MIDLSSAFLSSIIHYKGSLIEIGKEFILKINFVGVGRLAISIGNETIMNMRKNKIIKERMELNNELLYLMKTKIIIGEKNIWVAAEETEKSIAKLLTIIEKTKIIIDNDISEIYLDIDEIEDINLSKIEENNFGLINELLDILE